LSFQDENGAARGHVRARLLEHVLHVQPAELGHLARGRDREDLALVLLLAALADEVRLLAAVRERRERDRGLREARGVDGGDRLVVGRPPLQPDAEVELLGGVGLAQAEREKQSRRPRQERRAPATLHPPGPPLSAPHGAYVLSCPT